MIEVLFLHHFRCFIDNIAETCDRKVKKKNITGIDMNDIHNSFRLGLLLTLAYEPMASEFLPSRPKVKLPAHGGHACSPNREIKKNTIQKNADEK